MVRERVGDWRLAWRFALAGLVAGLLVAALSTRGVMNAPFFAAQDQLFPAPAPDQSVTFIAIDSTSQKNIGSYPFSNADHARVINYLASLHPKVILFDVVLDRLTADDKEDPKHPLDTNKPLAAAIKAAGHIVVVGTKLIDAGDVYAQAVSFQHDKSFCPDSRPRCMLDNQNYGYRIMGDTMTTILQDRYVSVQPASSILLAIVVLSLLVAVVVYALTFRVAMLFIGALLIAYYAGAFLLGKAGFLADPLYAPIAIVLSAAFSLGA